VGVMSRQLTSSHAPTTACVFGYSVGMGAWEQGLEAGTAVPSLYTPSMHTLHAGNRGWAVNVVVP
jgi:hypothetical protein